MPQLEPINIAIISLFVILQYTHYTHLLYIVRVLKSNTAGSIFRQVSKMVTYTPHHVCKALKELNVP